LLSTISYIGSLVSIPYDKEKSYSREIDMKYWISLKSSLIVAMLLCLLTNGLCFAQMDKGNSTVANETNSNISISQEAYDIGLDAYIYFYPLVTMDVTRRQMTNIEAGKIEGRGPMNTFSNARTFPPADFRTVVRPNFDTLYSTAWLNLTGGPVIVSVPDTKGRYYLLQMLDMWTDTFDSPGKRTTGTKAGNFAIVPQCWNGTLPAGVERIDSPTPYVWIIGRTQTNGTSDYEAVHKIQDGYEITPLSQWGKQPQPVNASIDPNVDMNTPPLRQVNSMPASAFFSYAAELMKVDPPHVTDQSIIARMKRIGIEPGKSLDFNKLDPAVQQALNKAAADGLKEMDSEAPLIAKVVNGWQMNTEPIGVYGNDYLKRAIIAMLGLGANPPEDAIYPALLSDADGRPLNGNNSYMLHFNKSELPPVDAFWSITMYDAEGFQAANSINRFAIGDLNNLTYNKDGSLDIYIQDGSPGLDRESNWLPSPRGPISILMRMYSPREEALDGTWVPPPLKRVQ
jgi:hypothetical protein